MKFLADENLNANITRGLQRQLATLDILTVQQAGLRGASDADVLARAADQGRVVWTHDAQTMPGAAFELVSEGLPMPGVIVIPSTLALARVISDLRLIVEAGRPSDFEKQVVFLPL